MAQNSALANAGESAPATLDLEQELLGGIPPLVVGAPETQTQQSKTGTPEGSSPPTVLRIGGEDLTPAQIEAAITEGRQAKLSLIENKDKLAIGETFFNLPPDQRQVLLDVSDQLSKGQNPLARVDDGPTLTVSEINLPEGASVPAAPVWADMDDSSRYLYAMSLGIHTDMSAKFQELGAIVSGMRGYLNQLHGASQEQQLLSALHVVGVPATTETLRAMRAKGIEPATAMKDPGMLEMMRRAHQPKGKGAAVAAAPNGQKAPEIPAGNADKTFDANDPNLPLHEIFRLLDEGFLPKDPADVARLKELRSA